LTFVVAAVYCAIVEALLARNELPAGKYDVVLVLGAGVDADGRLGRERRDAPAPRGRGRKTTAGAACHDPCRMRLDEIASKESPHSRSRAPTLPDVPQSAILVIMRFATLVAMTCLALGCGDLTSSGVDHPINGTYTVSTKLTQFAWETGAPDPPDCPVAGVMYCSHIRDFSGATLTGTLELQMLKGDSILATGQFAGNFCSAYGPNGCTAVQAVSARTYSRRIPFRTTNSVLYLNIHAPDPSSGITDYARVSFIQFRVSGDSLYGGVQWALTPGRSPPQHYGTFVARR
jgi:hypothetical protein